MSNCTTFFQFPTHLHEELLELPSPALLTWTCIAKYSDNETHQTALYLGEIAEKVGVSPRTIYRGKKVLMDAGLLTVIQKPYRTPILDLSPGFEKRR